MINQTEFSQIRLNLKLSKIVRSTSKALHFVWGYDVITLEPIGIKIAVGTHTQTDRDMIRSW